MPAFAFFQIPIEGAPSMHLIDAPNLAVAERQAVVAVKGGQLQTVRLWDGHRITEINRPSQTRPPATDGRDDRGARMIAMLAEGQTHRAIADTFGVSIDRARQLIARAEARARLRITEPNRAALSVHAQNVLVLLIEQPEQDGAERDRLLPERVAALTRKQIAEAFSAGKGTLGEIEAWLLERGLTLSDEV